MLNKLCIYGAGGHSKVVIDTAIQAGWEEIKIFDDQWPQLNKVGEWEVCGDYSDFLSEARKADGVIVALGDNAIRLEKTMELIEYALPVVSIIHPMAFVSSHADIDVGTVVFAGVVINAYASLGKACIVNSAAVIEHDCQLDDGVHVSPNAALAGSCKVGSLSWIGISACIVEGIKVGNKVVVGAGAAVIGDCPSGETFVGVPAKMIKEKNNE